MRRTHKSPILAIRDRTLAYLQAHSHGRQGEIAKACGIRREQVNRYVNGAVAISDIDILARLADWVDRDSAA
jgi:transcriptional regulator with XRE-family HTH domain